MIIDQICYGKNVTDTQLPEPSITNDTTMIHWQSPCDHDNLLEKNKSLCHVRHDLSQGSNNF